MNRAYTPTTVNTNVRDARRAVASALPGLDSNARDALFAGLADRELRSLTREDAPVSLPGVIRALKIAQRTPGLNVIEPSLQALYIAARGR